MNSIKQSQSNDEAQFLIRTFFKQIGLGKIIHQINFKRYTPISPLMMWFPVNKIDNLNRDFFVLCHD